MPITNHNRMINPIITQKLPTSLNNSNIGMAPSGARIYKIQCFFIVSYVNGSDRGSKNFLI